MTRHEPPLDHEPTLDRDRTAEQPDAETIWRELSTGRWQVLAVADDDGVRHVVVTPTPQPRAVDWSSLTPRERQVLALASRGVPQKVIAIDLGLSASTVCVALKAARERLGFPSLALLARAYAADGDRQDGQDATSCRARPPGTPSRG